MIVTNRLFNSGEHPHFKLYLFDGETSFGPLNMLWQDFFISKPLNPNEIERTIRKLKEIGIIQGEAAERDFRWNNVKKYSSKSQVIHLKGNYEGLFKQHELYFFRRQKPTDISRLTDNLLTKEVGNGKGIEILELQRKCNEKLREIHEKVRAPAIVEGHRIDFMGEALGKIFQGEDLKTAVRGKRKENRATITKAFSLAEECADTFPEIRRLQTEIDAKLPSGSWTEIDFKKCRLQIFVEERHFQKRTGGFLEERLRGWVENGKLCASDIELGKYDTPNPEIYLDSYVWENDGKFDGIVFGIYDIGQDFIDTEDGRIKYVLCANQTELRRQIALFRFEKSFLLDAGHNLAGFDAQKRLNPQREKSKKKAKTKDEKEKIIPGDGLFLVGSDNTELRYHSKKRGLEFITRNGGITLDSLIIGRHFFLELFPDMKLETMVAFFNHFNESFQFEFEKSLGSYTEIELMREDWEKGDIEKGKKLVEYCYYDTKAHYMLQKKGLLWPIYYIAEALDCDLFSAANKSPKDLAKLFWDIQQFNETNVSGLWSMKEDKEFKKIAKDKNAFVNIIADTNVFDKYEIRTCQKRIVDYVLDKSGISYRKARGFCKDVSAFYVPAFAQGLSFVLRRFKGLRKLYERAQTADTLHKVMYYTVLDAVASVILIDAKRTKCRVKDDKFDDKIFWAKYKINPDEFLTKFEANLTGMFNGLEGNIVSCTGDVVFVDGLSEEKRRDFEKKGAVYLGQADIIRLKHIYKNQKNLDKAVDNDESLIMNFDGLLSSTGLRMPSKKVRFDKDPESGDLTGLEIKIVYDFVQEYFMSGPEKALRLLDRYCKAVRENKWENKLDYLRTYVCNKPTIYDYADQDREKVEIMKFFGCENYGDRVTFAIGSSDGVENDYLRFNPDSRQEFIQNFVPRFSHYANKIFGGRAVEKGRFLVGAGESERFETKLYRIFTSLFYPNHKEDEHYEQKEDAFDRIKCGIGSEDDIRILLN
ncbi:hypothetical protein KY340_01040 [Candidatus Woesearchaeota archaeon]|nr:hypothetical protein [Candidatus Woesearchaeota archaeon]